MSTRHQGNALERCAITKGAKIRCDGRTRIRGVVQPCGQILAEVQDPSQDGGRHVVVCRRCGKRHTV